MNAIRLAVLFLLLQMVAGCTSLRDSAPPAAAEWEQRRLALLSVDEWELRGRIAVKDINGEGGQASLRWQQSGDVSQIRIAGPFGAGAYDMLFEPERMMISDGKGERSVEYTGSDAAEEFMADYLGWSFPADSTRYWILGLLNPAADGIEQTEVSGDPGSIVQHDWTVTYKRFAEFDGVRLPTRLELENSRVRLRVVISDWSLRPNDR